MRWRRLAGSLGGIIVGRVDTKTTKLVSRAFCYGLGNLLGEANRYLNWPSIEHELRETVIDNNPRSLASRIRRRKELLRTAFDGIRRLDRAVVYCGRVDKLIPDDLLARMSKVLDIMTARPLASRM